MALRVGAPPCGGVDARNFIQGDRVGPVAAVLRREFPRRSDEAVAIFRRHETVGRPLMGGRRARRAACWLADREVSYGIVALIARPCSVFTAAIGAAAEAAPAMKSESRLAAMICRNHLSDAIMTTPLNLGQTRTPSLHL